MNRKQIVALQLTQTEKKNYRKCAYIFSPQENTDTKHIIYFFFFKRDQKLQNY